MSLQAGIVGLPNVGKSTLFNALTKAEAHAANYPFATIDPNVGVVDVPDHRLWRIYEIARPAQAVPTSFEFIDIAGLVKGASEGEGLGNRFLSHIREVDAIIHVVRCFDDADVVHVHEDRDPQADVEALNTELMIADLELLNKRIPKIEKKARMEVDKETSREYELLSRMKASLEAGSPLRELDISAQDLERLKPYGLLTLKPVLYVANVSQEALEDLSSHQEYSALRSYVEDTQDSLIAVNAKLEEEMLELSEAERSEYLEAFGLEASGLESLIKKSYSLLGLETFFTTNEKEVRAWTFQSGMTAYECAGLVHTDFQRGFIKAEVIPFETLDAYDSIARVKEAGKMRIEGKDYAVRDGDLVLFKFNV